MSKLCTCCACPDCEVWFLLAEIDDGAVRARALVREGMIDLEESVEMLNRAAEVPSDDPLV